MLFSIKVKCLVNHADHSDRYQLVKNGVYTVQNVLPSMDVSCASSPVRQCSRKGKAVVIGM